MKNKSSAPSSSKRSMPAGPARESRKNQAMLDRSASLGDSGPMNAGSAFRVQKGFKKGGSVSCKTY